MKLSKDWKFVLLWAVFVMFLANIPYIYGYFIAPDGKQFMGDARCFIDTNSYIAWMQQATDGHVLFKDMYTTEPHARIFFHPFFLFLGNISRISGLSVTTVHSAARVIFGFAALLFLYVFTGYFIEDKTRRLAAFILLSLSGGFGWLRLIPAIDAIRESWFLTGWVEGNTFLSIYALPLFSASLLMLVGTFYFILRAFEENRIFYSVISGTTCFFLILTHSFDALIVYPVLFLYVAALYFIEQDLGMLQVRIKMFLIFFTLSVGAPIYAFITSLTNPVFFQHTWKEALTLSPNFTWYVGSFGFIGIFAVIGVLSILAKAYNNNSQYNDTGFYRLFFLVVWALAVPFLMYMPISFQRRLVEGVHVPLTILAAIGFFWVTDTFKKINWKAAFAVFFLLTVPNSINVLQVDMNYLHENVHERSMAGYLDNGIIEAMKWLKSNTKRDDVVLSDYETGNYIPALSGNKVFIGHSPETLNFSKKLAAVKMFFQMETPDDYRTKFLRDSGVKYLFYGWKEASVGSFNPFSAAYLKPVFDNKGVIVFEVRL